MVFQIMSIMEFEIVPPNFLYLSSRLGYCIMTSLKLLNLSTPYMEILLGGGTVRKCQRFERSLNTILPKK